MIIYLQIMPFYMVVIYENKHKKNTTKAAVANFESMYIQVLKS
jgi:hypothetical protein